MKTRFGRLLTIVWGLLFVLQVFPLRAETPMEPVRWLQEYLRLDTTNPPGNEHRGATFLVGVLRREGIPVKVIATPDGRTSVHAVLSAGGAGFGEALLLLHHIDIVPPGDGWATKPFSPPTDIARPWPTTVSANPISNRSPRRN